MPTAELARLGVVVHPERDLEHALATLQDWASRRSAEVVQIRVPGNPREVAPAGTAESSDVIVALGGDGTTLAALHAAAAVNRPVLGVACGSLGALSAVTGRRSPRSASPRPPAVPCWASRAAASAP